MSLIAVDLDGVVCNWASGFSRLANSLDSRAPLVIDNQCPEWEWKNWYGMPDLSRSERVHLIEETWRRVKASSDFWYNAISPLFPQDMPYLSELSRRLPVIFMTRRDGRDAWGQSVRWLQTYGVPEPLVYCVRRGEEKGDLCLKMGIDFIIEDSPKYAPELLASGVNVVLIEWPYNKEFRESYEGDDWSRYNDLYTAPTLGKALQMVEKMVY